jgi:hypothetical protein
MYIRDTDSPLIGEATRPFGHTLAGALSSEAIDCRLLHAANVAYGVSFSKEDSFVPLQPFYDKVQFVGPSIALSSGTNFIDGCLIGTLRGSAIDPAQTSIVLTFRGTYPPDPGINQRGELGTFIRDWANNFIAKPVPFLENPGGRLIGPGMVHEGLASSVQHLFNMGLVDKVRELMNSYPGSPLYVTGHSKGGAMACIAALRLLRMHKIYPTKVVTFAAPRVGDQTFVNAYNASLPNTLRYEFQDDIVPHLPPSNAFINTVISSSVNTLIGVPGVLLMKVVSSLKLDVTQLLKVKQSYEIVDSLRSLGGAEFVSAGDLRFINWESEPEIVTDSPELQKERALRLGIMLVWAKNWPDALMKFKNAHPAGCGSGYMKAVCRTGGC